MGDFSTEPNADQASDRVDIHVESYDRCTQQEDGLSGWAQQYLPLSGGTFRGEIAQVSFGDISIFRERVNVPIINRFCLPEDSASITIGLSGSASAANGYGEFRECQGYLIRFAGEEQVMCSGPSDLIGITFKPESLLGEETHYWTRIAGSAAQLGDWIGAMIGAICAARSAGRASDDLERIAPLSIEDRLSLHLADLDRSPRSTRRRIVPLAHAIVDAVQTLDPEELTVCLLSDRLQSSAADLRHAFRTTFERDLDQALVTLRLSMAFHCLDSATPGETTVSSVALDHGFVHWGRFAQTYRSTFGERPVDTLRRAPRSGPAT